MKKNKIIAFFMMSLFAGLFLTGCDDNIPKYDEVRVEKVDWNEDLKNGVSIEIGDESLTVADRMIVLPQNATNKMQSFSSSDPEVAIVDATGKVRTNGVGTTTITVTVDEKSDEFTLTVREKDVIRVSEIQIANPNIETMVGVTTDLSVFITVLPENAIDKSLIYESDDESVEVTQDGKIVAVKVGTAKITVASSDVPNIKGEFNVTIKDFKGDYPRDTWTLAVSQTLFEEGTNSITSALDGNLTTWFALVRPGKTYKSVSVPTAANGGSIHFIVDMKKSQPVNYFRIYHRNTNQQFLRYRMIETISGSNDNVNFTTIASDVAIPNVDNEDIESPNIQIPLSNYRYLKFYCQKNACFHASQGSSVQMNEFYLGLE